ncbi:MAG: hypothetical protein ACYSW7_12455 [Planctomycetota bacterium]|jgi:hypothetical protein
MNDLSYRLGFEDWRNVVKDIVTKARANNIRSGGLVEFGPRNAGELLSFFPESTRRNLWTDLFNAVDRAIEEITANDDPTVGTGNYLNELIRLKPQIEKKTIALEPVGQTQQSSADKQKQTSGRTGDKHCASI